MTPSSPSQPATGWSPSASLKGTNLPQAAVNAIEQIYALVYSLRDTVNQLQANTSRMLQYGTHANRLLAGSQAAPMGSLWFETDRPNVIYQARMPSSSMQWIFAGGAFYGTTMPTDLDTRDTGFIYYDTNQNQLWRWTGTAWGAI